MGGTRGAFAVLIFDGWCDCVFGVVVLAMMVSWWRWHGGALVMALWLCFDGGV